MLSELPTDKAFEFYRSFLEWYLERREGQGVYWEIGCNQGWVAARLAPRAKSVVAVDIAKFTEWEHLRYSNLTFMNYTSDEFFQLHAGMLEAPDVIFIDGSHEAKQVESDIRYSLKFLAPGGLIVVHDTYPPDAGHTSPQLCGDAYKAILRVRDLPSLDLQVFTFPVRFGVTLIAPRTEYIG